MLKISDKYLETVTLGELKIAMNTLYPLYPLTLQFSCKWMEFNCELNVLA
jgi:hypothetical protein